VTLSPGE